MMYLNRVMTVDDQVCDVLWDVDSDCHSMSDNVMYMQLCSNNIGMLLWLN